MKTQKHSALQKRHLKQKQKNHQKTDLVEQSFEALAKGKIGGGDKFQLHKEFNGNLSLFKTEMENYLFEL
jgi:predicted ATPase